MTRVFLLNPLAGLAWQAGQMYTMGTQIVSSGGLYLQQVTTPGISGGSLPSFNTSTGGTTMDGTVVWTCAGPVSTPVWIVPPDWNSADNAIECVGAGSAGDSNAPGGGGGGGAYSGISNLTLTPGANIAYSVGEAFFNHTQPGGGTWFNGASLAASSVGAEGGQPTNVTIGGVGGRATNGIGTLKTSGGAGGNGQGTVFAGSGGGGGGAGGSTGSGVTGINGDPTSGAGGAGGQSDFGSPLFGGGGGGGNSTVSPGHAGGAGTEWQAASVFPLLPAYGCGGGAGGAGFGGTGGTNGLGGNYGGGGGGASATAGQNAGAYGLLVITYAGLTTLSVSCGLPPVAVVGIPYSYTFPASGGLAPYTFSVLSGSLPPGLTLDASTGVVSGTPTMPGAGYTYTIQLTDSLSNTVTSGLCSGHPPYAPPPPPPGNYAIAVSRCPPLDTPTFYGGATPSVPDIVYVDCYSTPAVMDLSYIDNPGYPHFTAFNRPRNEADERHLWKALQRAWDAAESVLRIRE